MIAGKNLWNQWQDRISNDSIKNDLGIVSIDERARISRLRWWGHVERMEDVRQPKKCLYSETLGTRGRGRPRRRWIDSVMNDLAIKNLDLDTARGLAVDRNIWRGVVNA